ncbi:MAG: hypothetical protein ACK4E0_15285 [Chitinophagaceae bacterium]
MLFSKDDMSFVHYRWDTEEEPASIVYKGKPSTREFDPFNGNQVLYLINQYGELNGELSIKQARIIESLIAHQLPEGSHTESAVFNWIQKTITDGE